MNTKYIKMLSCAIALVLILTSMVSAALFFSDENPLSKKDYNVDSSNIVTNENKENEEYDPCSRGANDPFDYSIDLNKTVRVVDPGTHEDDILLNWKKYIDVKLGTTVDFRIRLTNTGEIGTNPIMYEHVEDHLPSNLVYIDGSANIQPNISTNHFLMWDLSECLEVGENMILTFSAEAVAGGEGKNYANVTCCKCFEWPKDNDTAIVNVICDEPCEPGIEIDKKVWNGADWVEFTDVNLGDTVQFKAVIYNPSDCYLIHFSGNVFDQLPSNLRYVNGSSTIFPEGHPYHDNPEFFEIYDWENNIVTWYRPPSINPHENLTFYYNATAVGCGIGVNNITAHPEGFTNVFTQEEVSNADGSYDVSDYATVNVICPSKPNITILKDVDKKLIHPGDSVVYKYIILNTGDCSLTNVVVTDDQGLMPIYVSGDTNHDDWLDLSEMWIYQATANPTDDVTNIGNVTAEDILGNKVCDDDDAFVDVIDPDISVLKKVNPGCVSPGEPATWNITVENTGDTTLTNVYVTDDNIGSLDSMITLDPGEKKFYEYITNPSLETINTVFVNGTDALGLEVVNSSSATVEICDVDINFDVEKEVKRNICGATYSNYIYVHEADLVTFRINVTNKGDVALDFDICDVLPAGLIYNNNAKVNDVSEEPIVNCWTINDVAPGSSVIVTFEAIVDECGEIINTATVTGYYDSYQPMIKENSATIFAICPGIEIEKTADKDTICMGEEVTYQYNVTNIGNHYLKNIAVTDDKISSVSYVSGDTDVDGELDIDEIWVYNATANPTDDVTNIGNVTAEDILGALVDDEDSAFVDVQECGCETNISIDKKIYYDGEWRQNLVTSSEPPIDVTFKIIVENIGTCDLENISIIDTYSCGIESLRDFTGDFTSYQIIGNKIYFTVNEPFTYDAEPIVILFNATIYINTTNNVEIIANSTYDQTQVCKHDSVKIEFTDDLPPVNHKPYKPVDETPADGQEDVSINPTLSAFVDDPDGDILDVSFYNESDVLLGTVFGVNSGTYAELALSALEYETWYSWYAVADDGEYTNTSDLFTFKTVKDTGLDPTVEITTPKLGSIYFRGTEINAAFLENAFVIGGINITVNADDEDGTITNIDFIINNEVKESTTAQYYNWNQRAFGWRTIKVVVTDNMGNTAEDSINVFMLNWGT